VAHHGALPPADARDAGGARGPRPRARDAARRTPGAEQPLVDAARALLRRLQVGLSRAASTDVVPPDADVVGGQRWGATPATDPALLARVRDALRARRPLDVRYRKAAAGTASPRSCARTHLPRCVAPGTSSGTARRATAYGSSGSTGSRGRRLRTGGTSYRRASRSTRCSPTDGHSWNRRGRKRSSCATRRTWRGGWRSGSGGNGADGSLVVEHRMADAEWAVRHVLQYGADAEVLAPAAGAGARGRATGGDARGRTGRTAADQRARTLRGRASVDGVPHIGRALQAPSRPA
jgi:hypothetical protein